MISSHSFLKMMWTAEIRILMKIKLWSFHRIRWAQQIGLLPMYGSSFLSKGRALQHKWRGHGFKSCWSPKIICNFLNCNYQYDDQIFILKKSFFLLKQYCLSELCTFLLMHFETFITLGWQDIYLWNEFTSSLTFPQNSSRDWKGSTKAR